MNVDEIRELIEKSPHQIVSGLIGENPTTYSKSRIMWNAVFAYNEIDSEYMPLDVSQEDLESIVNLLLIHPRVRGFNITNPYKEKVARYHAITIDTLAKIVGGVNTVYKSDYTIQGCSTDGYGVVKSIEEQCGESMRGHNTLVLGSGGSGSAIAIDCLEKGGIVTIANRTFAKAKELSDRAAQYGIHLHAVALYSKDGTYSQEFLGELKKAHIVINTIPIEKTSEKAIFQGNELSGKRKICMDIVYGHHSHFLELARSLGHFCVEGQLMLLHQAVKAFEYVYQKEIEEMGITTQHIISPMSYALTHFRFDESNTSIKRKIENARQEIANL